MQHRHSLINYFTIYIIFIIKKLYLYINYNIFNSKTMSELRLNSNIEGNYRYNPTKKEYVCLKRQQITGEEKIYNIRLADNIDCLWVNHRSYKAVKTDYIVKMGYVLFEYNGSKYTMKKDPEKNAVIKVQKLK